MIVVRRHSFPISSSSAYEPSSLVSRLKHVSRLFFCESPQSTNAAAARSGAGASERRFNTVAVVFPGLQQIAFLHRHVQ
jgi:hypothetical protein